MKISYICQLLTIGLFVELSLTLSLSAQAQSQFKPTSTTSRKQIISQGSFKPPKQGKPKDTYGAGSRSGLICSKEDNLVQPLMPKQNYGLALQEHPMTFVEIPKTSVPQVVLMFRRASLLINTVAGMLDFTQQKPKHLLEVSKNDQWFSLVVCGQTVQLDDPIFPISIGWVQEVARTSVSQ